MTVASPFSDFRYLSSNTIRPLTLLPAYSSKSVLAVSALANANSNCNNHSNNNNNSSSNHSGVTSHPPLLPLSSSSASSVSTPPTFSTHPPPTPPVSESNPSQTTINNNKSNNGKPSSTSSTASFDPSILLQDRECDLAFYQKYFLNQPHSNLVAAQSAQGPIVVSMAIDRKGCVRILIRTTQGSERIEHLSSTHSIPWYRNFFLGGFLFNNSNSPSYHLSILSQLCPAIPIESLEPCHHRDLPRELERMEERQVIRSYKFGVVMLLPGQTLEYQGLTNTKESCTPEFLDFLNWLGEPVQLQGWKGYRAGLDVIGDTTGEESVYTNWNGYQIMYHCAPLMPFNPKDHHQVERRRFIGNDIVVIVFKEDDDDEQFDLSSVGSRQNHIICIVRPIPRETPAHPKSYRVQVAVKDGIRNFSPLHFPTVLQRDDASRDLFLLKLICGERAAYRAKAFATQLSRTRESLLRDVIETHQ